MPTLLVCSYKGSGSDMHTLGHRESQADRKDEAFLGEEQELSKSGGERMCNTAEFPPPTLDPLSAPTKAAQILSRLHMADSSFYLIFFGEPKRSWGPALSVSDLPADSLPRYSKQ